MKESDNFASFLAYLGGKADVEGLILLGDTMDNWVCRHDKKTPDFDEILQAAHNGNIVASPTMLSENKKVIYMPGNHNMQVTEALIHKYFPKMIFGGSAISKSRYGSCRLPAEHGSAHAMFNAPDPLSNPESRLPLGYFIMRIITIRTARTGHTDRHYWTYIDDMLELLGPHPLFSVRSHP